MATVSSCSWTILILRYIRVVILTARFRVCIGSHIVRLFHHVSRDFGMV